jgi:hypothetical protein
MHSHRLWPVLAIAIASLVLGIGATAILGAGGLFTRRGPVAANGLYPAGPGVWGPGIMGRYPGAPPSCSAPALPGTVVDVTLTDMAPLCAAEPLPERRWPDECKAAYYAHIQVSQPAAPQL